MKRIGHELSTTSVSERGRSETVYVQTTTTDEGVMADLEIAEVLRLCETTAGATEETTAGKTSETVATDTVQTAEGRTDRLADSSKTTGEIGIGEMIVVEGLLLALEVRLEGAEDHLLQPLKGEGETRLPLIRDLNHARGHDLAPDRLRAEGADRLRTAARGPARLQAIAIVTETTASEAKDAGDLPPKAVADRQREARTSV